MVDGKIQSFEDLEVWQQTQDLAVMIYKLSKNFPREEIFGITSQLKRAASSVSANIAEGFGRRTAKDKLQFYTIAYGSLLETKNFLHLTQKLGFIDKDTLNFHLKQTITCQKLLNASMRAIKQ